MSVTASTFLGDPGPSVAATDVDWALIGVLRTWYETWLRIEAQERGLARGVKAPDGAAYANALDSDEWLDHRLPAVLVTTSKTQGRPNRRPDGVMDASWLAVVSVVVRGGRPSDTRDRAAFYEVALRRCLAHRAAVANAGGIVHSTRWESTEIVPVANVSRVGRYLAAGMTTFTVITDNALKDSAGPPAPVAPSDPLPTYVPEVPVTDVVVTVNGLSPNQTVGG